MALVLKESLRGVSWQVQAAISGVLALYLEFCHTLMVLIFVMTKLPVPPSLHQ